jgi:hypothetical protein
MTVPPITHTAPSAVSVAVESLAATKHRLGLDDAR